jgi:peptidoglycan-N-acetylmuramic acid deacetylase
MMLTGAVMLTSAMLVSAPAAGAAVRSDLPPSSARALPPNAARNWYFIPKGAHTRPGIPASAGRLLRRYCGVWAGDRHERVIYLTFDEGYENHTTWRIIGILRRAHVKASFFLTGQYIRANPKLTRSLAGHGHLVCSHSNTHPSMVDKARNLTAFTAQFRATERAYHAATDEEIAHFFRPPYGIYSARTLYLTERLGYTTVFWSFAHVDWVLADQPPVSVTLARILHASHPGAIYLLHAASPSDTNALAAAIRGLKRQGYSFATLDQLP